MTVYRGEGQNQEKDKHDADRKSHERLADPQNVHTASLDPLKNNPMITGKNALQLSVLSPQRLTLISPDYHQHSRPSPLG